MLSQEERRALIVGLIRSFDASSFTRFIRLLRQERGSSSRALGRVPHDQLIPQPGTPGPAPAVIVELVEGWVQVGLGTLIEALNIAEQACGGYLDPQLTPIRAQLAARARGEVRPARPSPAAQDPWEDMPTRAMASPLRPPAGSDGSGLTSWASEAGQDDEWGEGEHTSVVDDSLWRSLEAEAAGGSDSPGGYIVGAGDSEFEATQAKTVGYLLEDLDLDEMAAAQPGAAPSPRGGPRVEEREITGDTPGLRALDELTPGRAEIRTGTLDPEGFPDDEEEVEQTVALGAEARAALQALRKEQAARRAPPSAPEEDEGGPDTVRRSPPPVGDEDEGPGPSTVRSEPFASGGQNPWVDTVELQTIRQTEGLTDSRTETAEATRTVGGATQTARGGLDEPTRSLGPTQGDPTRSLGPTQGDPTRSLGDPGEATRILESPLAGAPAEAEDAAPRAGAFDPRKTIRSPHGMPIPEDLRRELAAARAAPESPHAPRSPQGPPDGRAARPAANPRGAPAPSQAPSPHPPERSFWPEPAPQRQGEDGGPARSVTQVDPRRAPRPAAALADPEPTRTPTPAKIPLTEVRYLSDVKAASTGGFVEVSFSGVREGLHALRLQGEGFEPQGTIAFEGRSGYRGLDTCYGRQAYVWFNPSELDDLLHRRVRYVGPDGRNSDPMPIATAPGQSAREVTPEVPEGATWVPPGVYLIPSRDEPHARRERYDTGFFLSTHPVSHAEYERFLGATGYRPRIDADFLRQRVEGRFPAALSDHPVVYVSLADARAYAQWLGGRLPTEAEWQRAVTGLDGRPYPWGSEMDVHRLNSRESRHGWSTPRGALPEGQGPFGHHDLLGNVWEWTDTAVASTDPPHHVIKGGSWVTGASLAHVDARSYALVTTRQFFLGFRVAWDRPGHGESTVAS